MMKLPFVALFVILSYSITTAKPARCNLFLKSGFIIDPRDWAWHVAIYQNVDNKAEYGCGGTLVTNRHVITAQHCVQNPGNKKLLTPNEIVVKLGICDLNFNYGAEIQTPGVEKIHTTSTFPRQDLRNDIAILELAQEAIFTNDVQSVGVSETKDFTGKIGTVIGWGLDENDEFPNEVRGANMPVVDFYTCLASNRDLFGHILDEGIFCAGHTNGTTVCNGDSGGGIFFKQNGEWFLGGIVSLSEIRGDGSNLCYEYGYGAFTRIYTYLEWIKSVTKLKLRTGVGRCRSKDFDPNENYSGLLSQNCDIESFSSALQPYDTYRLEFPWMASLRYKIEHGREMYIPCRGTLIHERYVLTTASCTDVDKPPYQVQFGKHSFGQFKECKGAAKFPQKIRSYGIDCIVRHPKATRINHIWTNDVALIRLDRDVIYEDHIRPACLPVTPSLRGINWPQNGSELSAPVLHHFESSGTNTNLCRDIAQATNNASQKNLFCINNNRYNLSRIDFCRLGVGSSWGKQIFEQIIQFGILTNVSIPKCYSSAYLGITEYMDWILANIVP